MIIEFKDSKMTVTHPTGIVSVYDKAHLEKQKEQLLTRKGMVDVQIQKVTDDISEC